MVDTWLILLLVICGAVAYLSYVITSALVKTKERVDKQTEFCLVALAASLYAASETRALKQAPILRQYIERFIPGEKLTDAEAQTKMNELAGEFQRMFGFDPNTKPVNKAVPTNGQPPEALV